jgi:GAF domain-containing protein
MSGPRVRPGEGAVGQAFATREPVAVEDYPAWDQALPHAIALGVRTVLAVPLLVGERALGVLAVRTHTPHAYPPEQVQLLALLAAQVAPTLEAARLYSEAERRRAEAEALAELAREGAAAADPDAVIGLITQRACQLVGADYAAVALLAPEGNITWRGTWGHRAPLRRVRTLQFAPGRNLTGRALANGGTAIVERLGDDPTIPSDEFAAHRAEGGRTLLGIVLRGR